MLMDIRSGATYLQLGQSTLRRWIADGKLPVVRLGRRVLLRREALDALVDAAERGKPEPGARTRGSTQS